MPFLVNILSRRIISADVMPIPPEGSRETDGRDGFHRPQGREFAAPIPNRSQFFFPYGDYGAGASPVRIKLPALYAYKVNLPVGRRQSQGKWLLIIAYPVRLS